MFEHHFRTKLYHTSDSELASNKQLWKINYLAMRINNITVQLQEINPKKAFMEVYAKTLRINLPMTRKEAHYAIDALEDDLEYKLKVLENCKTNA